MEHSKELSKRPSHEFSSHDLESGDVKGSNPTENQESSQNSSTFQSGSTLQDGATAKVGNATPDGSQLGWKAPAPDEIIIVHNQGHGAPNISLNCQADGHRQHIWAYAILSVIVQAGVLIYFGFATEYPTLQFEKNGRPVDSYAMPLSVAGTLLLVAGMLICSHVVNKSTRETTRQVDRSSCAISHIWLQKEKRVSDQLFKSVAIYHPSMISYENITSERNNENQTQTVTNTRTLETLTITGTFISVLGIAAQFTGLRGMHWTAAITQLGAIVLTSIIRAVVRLHLAPRIKDKALNPGFELDWFVTSLVASPKPSWLPERVNKSVSHRLVSPSLPVVQDKANESIEGTRGTSCLSFTIKTCNSRFSKDPESTIITGKDGARQTEGASKLSYDKVVSEIHTTQGMLDLRLHLGKLGKWESPVSKQANILFCAIEETLGFFTSRFKDCFPDEPCSCSITMGADSSRIRFNLEWGIDTRRASYDELHAALSMWVYSASSTKDARDFNADPKHKDSMRAAESSEAGKDDPVAKFPCLQILGPATEVMDRDLALWLPAGMLKDQTLEENSDEAIDQMIPIKVGRSGQWHERDNKERVTDQKSSRVTVSSHHSQQFTRNNELGSTEDQGFWKTFSSQEEPNKFYAKDIFSSFVWALAQHVAQSAIGEHLEASVRAPDEQSNVKLRNRDLQNLVERIVELGSWTRRDVYLCVIPPLSSSGVLPGVRPFIDRAIELRVAFEKRQKWKQAFKEYNKLYLLAPQLPPGSHAYWKSLAILARFDARISKPGTRWFGSQRDDAYESDEVSEVRDKIHGIFMEENQNSHDRQNPENTGNKRPDPRETLKEALDIYTIFPESLGTLQRIALWDPSKKSWQAEVGRNWSNRGSDKRVTRYVDRDIFDRTPFHHAMRSNVPTQSQSLPRCDLQDLEEKLNLQTHQLAGRTNQQINWSEDSLTAMRDPATECSKLMESEADPSALDLDHWTPLHYACHIVLPLLPIQPIEEAKRQAENQVDKEVVKQLEKDLRTIYHKRAVQRANALIGRKVDVNAQALDGTTPLHCAAESGCEELVELLVKHKANINAQKIDGTTPLHCATMSRCVKLIKFLLRHQATETTGPAGRTLLHLAAMTNNSAMFAWLKTTAEVQDQAGRTPLHLAAMYHAPASISELVDLGAKMDAKDHQGKTPLHLACLYDRPDSVRELLKGGAENEQSVYIDPNAKDERGRTPLHLAALFNSSEAIRALTEWDSQLSNFGYNSKDVEGRSPLHLAAFSNALDAVPLLMDRINDHSGWWPPKDEDSQTPFHLAAAQGHADAIKLMGNLMMEHKPDSRAKVLLHKSDTDEFTAFSIAAHNGHVSCMKAILDITAKKEDPPVDNLKRELLQSTDVDDDTPYMDAIRNRIPNVLKALEEMAADNLEDLWPQGW